MKAISVSYTTTTEFAMVNQANIAGIVKELRELGHSGIKYGAWLLPDGKTFVHLDQFEDEEAHKVLTSLESFKKFDRELLASGWESEPTFDWLSPVASTETYW